MKKNFTDIFRYIMQPKNSQVHEPPIYVLVYRPGKPVRLEIIEYKK